MMIKKIRTLKNKFMNKKSEKKIEIKVNRNEVIFEKKSQQKRIIFTYEKAKTIRNWIANDAIELKHFIEKL